MDTKSDRDTIKKAFPCKGCLIVSICEDRCEPAKKVNRNWVGRLAITKGICGYCGEWVEVEDNNWRSTYNVICNTCRHETEISKSSASRSTGNYKIHVQGVKDDRNLQERFLGLFKR